MVLSIFLQLVLAMAVFGWFAEYVIAAYWLQKLIGAVGLIIIVNDNQPVDYKLIWMLPIIIAPVIGVLMYIFVTNQYGKKHLKKELDRQQEKTSKLVVSQSFSNCSVEYFGLGERKFEKLFEELEKAEKFIFLEYFIVDYGVVWDRIFDLLQRKARAGVEVRLLYDGMCSLTLLPFNFPKKISKYGIKSKMFAPIYPLFSTCQNNRDHRKIVVIDGKIAFTGGINLADEYANKIEKFGHWKDCAVMLSGAGVNTFTLMFLQMWNVGEKLEEDYVRYIVEQETFDNEPGFVMPFGDNPFGNERVGKQVYLAFINNAKDYVTIMTPYLVPDEELQNALISCAKRGTETIIIMPHIPDKKTAFYLAKTYYPKLLAGGVRIYEYAPGFVHSKVIISDDKRAVVGSINMDYRSMYLQFECGLYMEEVSAIADIKRDIDCTLEKCIEITENDCEKLSLGKRIIGRVLRLVAPLM